MIDFLYNGHGGLIHSLDLFDSTFEKVGVVSISNIKEIALVLLAAIEPVLMSIDLPILTVLQQHNYPVLIIKSHAFYVRIHFYLH